MLRPFSHTTFALIAILPAWGQTAPQQSAPEMTTQDQMITFKTAVNSVNVPVVVRDSEGRAVGNLTKDDFQLFDRGKLQSISRFTVEKTEGKATVAARVAEAAAPKEVEVAAPVAPAAILPERFVAYLFDDIHAHTSDLVMARDAADRHMKKTLGPKVRAAVYTTSGQT